MAKGKLIVLPSLVPVAATPDIDLVWSAWYAGLAEETRAAYQSDLGLFAAWLQSTGIVAAGARDAISWLIAQRRVVAEATVLRYLQGQLDQGHASASVRRRRAAIRSAVKLCARLGLVEWQLDAGLARGVERKERRSTAGPSMAQLTAILQTAAAQQPPLKAARDVTLLRLLLGLRVRGSEICRLRVDDYHDGAVRLVLKGHREGVLVAIPPGVAALLDAYLAQRGALAATAPLFASGAGSGAGFLTRGGLYQLISTLARQAGVPQVVSPHRLLHTASTALAEAGVSTDDLQQWGRWEKRETAERYMDHVQRTGERLADQLDAIMTAAVERE